MAQSRDYPPNVPNGWKAVFDEQYQTWYYVDLRTNKSQWEPPRGTTWPTPQNSDHLVRPQMVPPVVVRCMVVGHSHKDIHNSHKYSVTKLSQFIINKPSPCTCSNLLQQPTSHSHKSGMGSGLLGAGAGLLGGMLLADALRPEDNIL